VLDILRGIAAEFSVEVKADKLSELDQKLVKTIGSAEKLGTALLAGAAVRGLANFIDEIRQTGVELDQAAERFGLSTQAVQEWRYAAGTAGVGVDHLNISFSTLARNMETAARGVVDQQQMFRQLGVSVKGTNGEVKDLETILPDIIDGLAAIESPTKRSGLAMRLFGEHGSRLLPLFNQGSAGLAKLRQEFQRLGGGLSKDAVEQAAAYTAELKELDVAWMSVKSTMAVQLFPVLARMIDAITSLTSTAAHAAENTLLWEAALVSLAGAAGLAASSFVVLNPLWGAAALAIGTVVGAVEELDGLLTGKAKTSLELFVDEFAGLGRTAETVSRAVNLTRVLWAGVKDKANSNTDTGLMDVFTDPLGTGQTQDVSNTLAVLKAIEEERQMGGAGLPGDVRTSNETRRGARGGRNFDPAAQTKALMEGNPRAFQESRRGSQDWDAAYEEFLQKRFEMLKAGQVQPTADDIAQFGAANIKPQLSVGTTASVMGNALPEGMHVGPISQPAQVGPVHVRPSVSIGTITNTIQLSVPDHVATLPEFKVVAREMVQEALAEDRRKIIEAMGEETE
jgi:hypothetical protein